jgi:ribosomal protein S18 acetylase RimI-like enzyme
MTRPVTVRGANEEDVEPWLALARDVEPLFGPMPDIAEPIRRGIARGTALVAQDVDGRFAGAALLSRDDQPHVIHWLAVRPGARRQGIGSALVTAILARWDDTPIEVVTFGVEVAGGEAARALYAAHGFEFKEHNEKGPEGGSRERWIRR